MLTDRQRSDGPVGTVGCQTGRVTLLDATTAGPGARTPGAALARAAAGERLDAGDAHALLTAQGVEFERMLTLAAAARDEGLRLAGRPGVITYSRKVFVPLTTLCRDRCHYCVFVDTPGQLRRKGESMYMTPDRVLAVARQGQALGCKEALLTLGDRPEERWPEARTWLDEHGYASTLDYVGAMARLITEETGLLAHLNPGVMSHDELTALRPVAPSMGMMLETTSRRLFEEPGQVHYGSPDKDPAVRLQVIEDAGRAGIPFTTGILVGIGETLRDRAESLVALRDAHERHGHVQEVIVQNFAVRPEIPMAGSAEPDDLEMAHAVAMARLILDPEVGVQSPPNLNPARTALLLRAGINDFGGISPVTPDYINPLHPWPHLEALAAACHAEGFTLRPRLPVYERYLTRDGAVEPALRGHVDAARARLAAFERWTALRDDPAQGVHAIEPQPALHEGAP